VKQAIFIFHNGLEVFLAARSAAQDVVCAFQGRQSVKHLVESLGVPHVEIKRIEVNQVQVSFKYLVQDGDFVQVYPFQPGDFLGDQDLPMRFVLDNHLGQLAAYLRMLGVDAEYRNDYEDGELAAIASRDGRILLTRDRRLLMRSIIEQGYWMRSKMPREQLREVATRYNLYSRVVPFSRCMHCNGSLEEVSKEQVLDRLEPLTKRYFFDFHRCPDCDQIYWKGSHYEQMRRFIDAIMLGKDSTTLDSEGSSLASA
jgi:uncharacterized protein with PIN domain